MTSERSSRKRVHFSKIRKCKISCSLGLEPKEAPICNRIDFNNQISHVLFNAFGILTAKKQRKKFWLVERAEWSPNLRPWKGSYRSSQNKRETSKTDWDGYKQTQKTEKIPFPCKFWNLKAGECHQWLVPDQIHGHRHRTICCVKASPLAATTGKGQLSVFSFCRRSKYYRSRGKESVHVLRPGPTIDRLSPVCRSAASVLRGHGRCSNMPDLKKMTRMHFSPSNQPWVPNLYFNP